MGTHTEIYRPYRGELGRVSLRFWPVAQAALRVATKKKLPMLLLLNFPVATVFMFSFLVYTKYAVAEGTFAEATGFDPIQGALVGVVAASIEVKKHISEFHVWSRFFSLLILAWYGAGLFADDRRSRAHLLYFSRPLTRLDYVLGKYAALLVIGVLVTVVPGLVICLTAVFSSPEWSFLLEETQVLYATVAYGALRVMVLALMVLAVSSVSSRKSFALIGVFLAAVVPGVIAQILRAILGGEELRYLSPWFSLRRIGHWMLELRTDRRFDWPVSWSFMVVAGFTALCALVIWWRTRKLEVVG